MLGPSNMLCLFELTCKESFVYDIDPLSYDASGGPNQPKKDTLRPEQVTSKNQLILALNAS